MSGMFAALEECKICTHPLAKEPVVILTKDAKRVCKHFFHEDCVQCLEEGDVYKCPFCRVEFNGRALLPNIRENPKEWFKFVDFDKRGTLSYENILEALRASIHIDHTRLASELPAAFKKWDINGDGRVSYDEMMDEKEGLVEYARQYLPKLPDYSEIPDIRTMKRQWFTFWDRDKNGRLDPEEVVRALLKTFHRESSPSEIIQFRNLIKALWNDLDPDYSGGIDADEFCKEEGLCDCVVANMKYAEQRVVSITYAF